MRLGVACLVLIGLAACQPGGSGDEPQPAASPAVVSPVEPEMQPAAYPEATGPVANYFRAELPASFQGRWAEQVSACAGEDVFVIGAKAFESTGLSAEIGDIEVNESRGAIINLIANGTFKSDGQVSEGRASMKLSLDGSRLNLFVMGMPRDPALPPELVRCR